MLYTENMKFDFSNRYLQMSLLGLGIAVLIYLLLWLILSTLGLDDFPVWMRVTVAVLAAGYVVYQFFSDRIR